MFQTKTPQLGGGALGGDRSLPLSRSLPQNDAIGSVVGAAAISAAIVGDMSLLAESAAAATAPVSQKRTERRRRAHPLLYVCVAAFAWGPWLGPYAANVETDVFTQKLPEGWTVGSVINIVIQISMIGPIIYVLIDRCTKIPVPHIPIIQTALIVSALLFIPAVFWWDSGIWLFGKERSVVLFGSLFGQGMIAIGSDVIFVPVMSRLDPVYLPAYFVGNGLSGLMPSAISLAQGATTYECRFNNETQKTEPFFLPIRFSVNVVYAILFFFSAASAISFYILMNFSDRIEQWNPFGAEATADEVRTIANGSESTAAAVEEPIVLSKAADWALLITLGLTGMQMNTLIPSIQSYASLPFSQWAFFWALILTTSIQPIAAAVASFVRIRTVRSVLLLLSVCLFTTLIVVILSAQSPNPWLAKTTIGGLISIFCQVSSFGVGQYLTVNTLDIYRDGKPDDAERRLFFGGLAFQVGSLLGTVTMFPLVNVFGLFHEAPQCE